jgi:hypothetical protein
MFQLEDDRGQGCNLLFIHARKASNAFRVVNRPGIYKVRRFTGHGTRRPVLYASEVICGAWSVSVVADDASLC